MAKPIILPPNIVLRDPAKLIPYANNAKIHSVEQIKLIAGSIREFGFNNPILLDGDNGIIAGHGRAQAAEILGMEQVPTIDLAHLSPTQKKAYILADNRTAEVGVEWDLGLVQIEFESLKDSGFNVDLTGMDKDFVYDGKTTLDDQYTRKIVPPTYEPKGENPPLEMLVDLTKTMELLDEIEQADIPQEIADFLRLAAERHTVFNFGLIAEYYCHAEQSVQSLMERSALVIIDFNAAIEGGFVKLAKDVADQYTKDYEGRTDAR